MKAYRQILILSIFIAFTACQPYSEEDIKYFETSMPYLDQGRRNMEASSQSMLKQMEKNAKKYRGNEKMLNTLRKGYELVKKTTKVNRYLGIYPVLGITDYDLFENKETAYLKASHVNYYIKNEKVSEIDSVIQNYITFIETQYPQLLTEKLKTWKKETTGFLKKQCDNLPVVGAWARLLDIQIQLLSQEQIILNHLITSSENGKFKDSHTEHLHFVFSEEKDKVKLGETYTAKLFLAIAHQMPDMVMEINGQKVPVKDGIGKLRFKAQELGKYYWQGKTTFKDPATGKDTTFTTEQLMYEVIPKQE